MLTALVVVVSGMSTANSSPPQRASRSPARSRLCHRSAAFRRRSSPARWPWASLNALKWSRSRRATDRVDPDRPMRAISRDTTSSQVRRLASPVSGSWLASAASRAMSSARSSDDAASEDRSRRAVRSCSVRRRPGCRHATLRTPDARPVRGTVGWWAQARTPRASERAASAPNAVRTSGISTRRAVSSASRIRGGTSAAGSGSGERWMPDPAIGTTPASVGANSTARSAPTRSRADSQIRLPRSGSSAPARATSARPRRRFRSWRTVPTRRWTTLPSTVATAVSRTAPRQPDAGYCGGPTTTSGTMRTAPAMAMVAARSEGRPYSACHPTASRRSTASSAPPSPTAWRRTPTEAQYRPAGSSGNQSGRLRRGAVMIRTPVATKPARARAARPPSKEAPGPTATNVRATAIVEMNGRARWRSSVRLVGASGRPSGSTRGL